MVLLTYSRDFCLAVLRMNNWKQNSNILELSGTKPDKDKEWPTQPSHVAKEDTETWESACLSPAVAWQNSEVKN